MAFFTIIIYPFLGEDKAEYIIGLLILLIPLQRYFGQQLMLIEVIRDRILVINEH
jgi:hypothetical protein